MSVPPGLQGKLALVTGGAGFIGSHLVDALLEKGPACASSTTSRAARARTWRGLPVANRFRGGRHPRLWNPAAAPARALSFVFHQAALGSVPRSMSDPATTIAVNVAGTANVFAAAREARVARVIYASSSSVYGDSQTLPKREGEEGSPLSPYALSKRMNEQLADVFGRCFGMQFVGLRYFNVYGPRQDPDGPYAAVIPRFFKACLAGEAPVIYGDGEQSRDFTYVSDAVAANLLAAKRPNRRAVTPTTWRGGAYDGQRAGKPRARGRGVGARGRACRPAPRRYPAFAGRSDACPDFAGVDAPGTPCPRASQWRRRTTGALSVRRHADESEARNAAMSATREATDATWS